MSVFRFFRECMKIPSKFLRLCRLIDQLEAGAQSAEALFYLTILRETWPEAIAEMMPRIRIPGDAVSGIAGWYTRMQQPKSLQTELNRTLVSMAEGLVSLPLVAKIALFEEALRVPSQNTPFVFNRYIRFLAQYADDDKPPIRAGDRFLSLGPDIWCRGFEESWGLYMAALIRIGRTDDALEILERHNRKYRLQGIECIPPAALFAREHGFGAAGIKQAAELMRIVTDNEQRNACSQFISGKSIAIVGNSPLECGRGVAIDNHDTIIRFNIIQSKPEYIQNFGRKTSILSRNLSPSGAPLPTNVGVILIPDGLERIPLPLSMVKAFLSASRRGQLLLSIPLSEYRSILRDASITNMSTGVVVCSYIKKMASKHFPVDLYGFSHLLDNAARNYGEYERFHYFCRRCDDIKDTIFHPHPRAKEREFLLSLFPVSDQSAK